MSQSFKVFAVDDDPVVRDIMTAILEPDCEIHTFPTAEDCLNRMATDRPDYFLLDVNLPGIDGYTLCRRIKDDVALRNTPVTFVSGLDNIEERVKGYDAGGEDFIVKPFEPEELLRKLLVAQNLVRNQRSLTAQVEDAELGILRQFPAAVQQRALAGIGQRASGRVVGVQLALAGGLVVVVFFFLAFRQLLLRLQLLACLGSRGRARNAAS